MKKTVFREVFGYPDSTWPGGIRLMEACAANQEPRLPQTLDEYEADGWELFQVFDHGPHGFPVLVLQKDF